MLRITVELLPKGDASRSRHLGTAYITNDGSGDTQHGNYTVVLSKWDKPSAVWREGRVEGFPRRSRGSWDLLFRALRACVGVRNAPR